MAVRFRRSFLANLARMAILSVNEITGREGSEDEEYKQKSTRLYQVLTNSATHTETEILAAGGLPVLFDVHPSLTGAMVVNRNARQSSAEDDPTTWEVSIDYSSVSRSKIDPAERSQNPTDRPAVLKIAFEQRERGLYVDLEGDAIVNSAREFFDPPLVTEETVGIITITRNIASVSFATYMDFNGATNSATFMGFAPDTLKIGLEAERSYEQGTYFFIVTATIKVRLIVPIDIGDGGFEDFGGWQSRPLDAGYRYADGTGTLHQITDDEGNPVTKPIPLDGGGASLTPGDPPRFAPVHFIVNPKPWYVVTKRRNFSDLNLI